MVEQRWLDISLAKQSVCLRNEAAVIGEWPCSTATNGAGEAHGSGCTPRGRHHIRALIGGDMPAGSVFVGRRATGERYSQALSRAAPERDWILSRIIWLTGDEAGINRGTGVDTLRRFIYIHGTPDTQPMGTPRSHGCIRMRNVDVIDLFAQCYLGMSVLIGEPH